ncbi:uncharacterized protein RAG0_06740 [Rhynchosporium agropyri]|uniref:Uncharacterized protein n=1 Tax=Rhynchosporium agropyri TaxID=914238 RepID=A0A1E1KIR0_9HELO|nr:uncharacterized protein RAG0_06740 [Rhynchosporium agropyri]
MDFPTSTGVTQRPDIDPFIHPSNFTGLLSGKVGILTGASKGIDRTFNLALAVSGASLALLARSAANMSSAGASLESEMRKLQEEYQVLLTDPKEFSAWILVALAVKASSNEGKGLYQTVEVLAGRYREVEYDLGELLKRGKEVEERDLCKLTFKNL